ncbi:protein of unknown function [Marivirga sericea]|uniref:DUF4249 domain-containing protein n=1 Tax=Marivirga sericea TaxID=1028 RepID=A0A1X7JHQ8_9BACT|nr:DUF4249 family protein [Marivirga sericea]SMG27616.1 protein of unknown function [Marivirga sericea]
MKINLLLLVSLLPGLLFSCVSDVDVQLPEHSSKIVLYSVVSDNDTIKGYAGLSSDLLSENIGTEDLDIELFENNELVFQSSILADTHFNTNIIANNNSSYHFKISSDNQEAEAFTLIPEAPVIEDIKFTDSVFISEFGPVSRVEFVINDSLNKPRFYEVELSAFYDLYYPNGEPYPGSIFYGFNSHPIIIAEDIERFAPYSIVFSNRLFNKTRQTISIYYYRVSFFENGPVDYDYKLIVECKSITEDLYLYKKSLFKHLETQSPDIVDGFDQINDVYSNIINGYGVLGATNIVLDTVNKIQ